MKSQLFILCLLVSALVGCSSSREISIKSTPDDAEVFIKELGSEKLESIGKTPLILEEKIINRVINSDKAPVLIEVRRSGYMKQQLIINNLGKTNIQYDLDLESNNVANIISQIDNVGPDLFEVQRLIRAGGYEESLKMLKALNETYPYSSIIHELTGDTYYFKKDFKNSLIFYDMAYKFNPKNSDAFKMKKYLEDELGVERPLAKKGSKQ